MRCGVFRPCGNPEQRIKNAVTVQRGMNDDGADCWLRLSTHREKQIKLSFSGVSVTVAVSDLAGTDDCLDRIEGEIQTVVLTIYTHLKPTRNVRAVMTQGCRFLANTSHKIHD